MDLAEIKKIYFIGIGGIGMSALARYFKQQGKKIYGYDKRKTTLTKKLEREGMSIHYKLDIDAIPKGIDLVIYTPAISSTNKELVWFKKNGYPVIKRAKALGDISATKSTLAIAGTHGKTTTSSILSHILKVCNTKATAIVGGLMVDYDGNFFFGEGNLLVTEADEYDRSFLELSPDCAAIMSMDADHLDIYESLDKLIEGFEAFTLRVRPNGKLFLKAGLLNVISKNIKLELYQKEIEFIDFGSKDAILYVENPRMENAKYVFDIGYKGELYPDVISVLPGAHNAENVSVAFGMAIEEGLNPDEIIDAIGSFKGIKRRYERVLENDQLTIIDDYAHHPTEIDAAIATTRFLYPDRSMTVVFQPHLFSRTRDFAGQFATALSKADSLILLDIYPAREEPIEGVSALNILEMVELEKKDLVAKKKLIECLEKEEQELILILGAGDIDKEVSKIKKHYKKK